MEWTENKQQIYHFQLTGRPIRQYHSTNIQMYTKIYRTHIETKKNELSKSGMRRQF